MHDAQPPDRAPAAARRHGATSAARSGPAGAGRPDGAEHLAEFRLEAGLPVWRYEVDGARRSRSGVLHAPPPEHRHVSYRLRRRGRPAAPEAAARRSTSGRTTRRSSDAPAEPYTLTVGRRPVRARTAGRRCRRCGCGSTARPAALHARRPQAPRASLYRVEESRGYDARGDLWSPGYFRADLRAGRDRHPGRLDRAVGDASTRSPPDEARQAELERRRAAARRGRPARPATGSAGRAGAGRRPVPHHARPAASRTPPAPAPPATRSAPSSPATTGSPTGAATP